MIARNFFYVPLELNKHLASEMTNTLLHGQTSEKYPLAIGLQMN